MSRAQTLVVWGAYDRERPRLRNLLAGLRARGWTVVEVHAPVWAGVSDRAGLRGAAWLRLALRWAAAMPGLLARYLAAPPHDWVLVPYPGIPQLPLLGLFSRLRGARIVWDFHICGWDTLVRDRRLVSARHPAARLAYALERCSLRVSSRVFMDTRAHAAEMERLFGATPGRVGSVWLGVEPGLFPTAPPRATGEGPLRLLFFGQFSPLHGVEVIVAAARLLEERGVDVEWTLVGRGQVSARVDSDLAEHPIPSIRRIDWVPFEQLGGLVAASDVCLGIFGTTRKGAVTLQNKTFQALAVGRHILTADTAAMRELLDEAPSVCPGVTLVAAGEPAALADAVERLARDWAAGRAPEARPFVFGPADVARQFEAVLG